MMNQTTSKIGVKTKLSYAVGQMADSASFNLYYCFFLYFLTDFAGMNPALAGMISLIAILWDAVTDPIIGYISDNLKSKYGRRRPMILAGAIPYGISVFLLFNNIDLGGNAQFFYFLAVALLFWTSFTTYDIPFFSLGAELSEDFNERTSLRAWSSVFMYLASMLATALPPILLSKLQGSGYSSDFAWNFIGVLFMAITILAGLVCWNFTRGKEDKIDWSEVKDKAKMNFFTNYISAFKLKPVKWLLLSVFSVALIAAVVSNSSMYMMNHVLGFSAEKQSLSFIIYTIVNLGWIPVVNILSQKVDKKYAYAIALGVSAATALIVVIMGYDMYTRLVSNYAIYIVFLTISSFGTCAFWTLYFAMMYDLCEVDEFVNGTRKEGTLSALTSFFQKLGAASASWLTGMLLAKGGYDAALAVQTIEAKHMIFNIFNLVPLIGIVIGILAILKYPMTKKRFYALLKALKLKRAGKEYSTDGFKELL
ncbi:MFS transporter [Ihubacter massiliensis]|uniref:MFS transporter n=1 Tax=Hominibacterium faecale TaxID=2839743 RepID=A0A9J6QWG0_9FIRM|nr:MULTISPECIES: MFS transporter [Eubacteriales Family XIII. Incertae Sedis]MCO7123371.1 MFS transporter [Ihubacter massiliensis]MCU7379686.1 MFS transporter [Hominibacterium faecale]